MQFRGVDQDVSNRWQEVVIGSPAGDLAADRDHPCDCQSSPQLTSQLIR